MERNSFFPGLAAVFRCAACWCSAFWLFTLTSLNGLQGLQPLPFLTGALVCYLVIRRFLGKPRTVQALAALGCGLTVLLSGLLLWRFSQLAGFAGRLFCVIAVGTTVLEAARVCLEPPTAAKCISAMELTTLYFLVFVWAQATAGLDPVYCLPLLTAVVLSLLVLPYQRLANSSSVHGRSRGVVLLAAVIIAIFLVLVLFVLFGAAPLGRGVTALAGTLMDWGKVLLSALGRFLTWLLSLLPRSESGELPDMEPLPQAGELTAGAEPSPAVMAALLLLVGALALTGLCFLLRSFRHHRVGGQMKTSAPAKTVQRRRLSLLAWLRRLLGELARHLRLAAAVLAQRGTPQEVYFFLTRTARRLRCPRQSGETPAAFLRRMKGLVREDPALPAALDQLSLALDRQLYSPAPAELSPETVRLIRRGFRRLARRSRPSSGKKRTRRS